MIDIKELRIGNWINPLTSGIQKVELIKTLKAKDGELLFANNFLAQHIFPIPLTAEILEKAGFSKHKNSSKYWTIWWLPNRWYINQSHHTEPSAGVRIGYFYFGDNYLEIQYLHQLQNLYFALTGQELEIEL